MSIKKLPRPTESELSILQILWEYGASPVRFVNEKINSKIIGDREIGYTTTLKLMQIMVEKGLAKRNTETRTHVYSANVNEGETQKLLLRKFLDSTFRGSAMKLVMQALGENQTSSEELEKIKNLIRKIEEKN